MRVLIQDVVLINTIQFDGFCTRVYAQNACERESAFPFSSSSCSDCIVRQYIKTEKEKEKENTTNNEHVSVKEQWMRKSSLTFVDTYARIGARQSINYGD